MVITHILKSKLAKYTNKGGISLNGGKMVMLGGKKLEGYRVWSVNRGKMVCREYNFSILND